MFAFLNGNRKILFYFCYVININSHSLQELNDSCFIGKGSVSRQRRVTNEIEPSQIVPLDLSLPTRERNKCKANEHYLSSLLSNIQEDCLQNILYEQESVEESNSSEKSEYIDVVNIDESDSNKHNGLMVTEIESNQIEKSIFQDTSFNKNFHNKRDKTHIPESLNVFSSKSQYNRTHQYDTMRFDDVPSSSNGTFAVSTNLDYLKTNEKHINEHEGKLFTRPSQQHSNFATETIKQKYLPNLVPIKRIVHLDNIVSENSIHLVERENISNPTRSLINENSNHLKHPLSGQSYKPDDSSELSRNKFKYISKILRTESGSVPSTPQIIRDKQNHTVHAGNQLERTHTLSTFQNAVKNSIKWVSTTFNTLQQAFQDTDFNTSHVKQSIPKIFSQILMKEYKGSYNDEPSLEKISGNFYYFNFIIKNTLFLCKFNREKTSHLSLKISGVPIIRTDIGPTKGIYNISSKSIYSKHYVFYIPIFHAVNFVVSNDVDYFKISVSSNKYETKLRLDVYIYRLRQEGELKLHLKCPRIHDFKQLFNKLLDTTFPIYPFNPKGTKMLIRFRNLKYLREPIKEITLKKYIQQVKRNRLNINIQHKRKYKTNTEFQIGKRKYKNKIVWISGFKIVYDIFMTFNKNIKQILELIDDDSKSLDLKRTMINELLTQIIQKIKNNFVIYYPLKRSKDHQIEVELMSFYPFCINELQNLFEWWNRYLFVNEEVQYIETGL